MCDILRAKIKKSGFLPKKKPDYLLRAYALPRYYDASCFFRAFHQLIQLVVRPYFLRHFKRHAHAFSYGFHRFQVVTHFFQIHEQCPCRRTGDEQTVAHAHVCRFDLELSHSKFGKVFDGLAHVDLFFRGGRAVVRRPFA